MTDTSPQGPRESITWLARAIGYLIYAYVIIVEIILLVGFILKLFGANPSAGFVEWWYRGLDRVMAPFRGIFTPVELGTTGNDVEAVLDTSILFAMVIYAVIMLFVRGAIDWMTHRLELQRHDREIALRQRELEEAEQQRALAEAERRRADALMAAQAGAVAATSTVPSTPVPPTPDVMPASPPPPDVAPPAAGTSCSAELIVSRRFRWRSVPPPSRRPRPRRRREDAAHAERSRVQALAARRPSTGGGRCCR